MHRALMRDGRVVVVKVRRPRIEELVEVDLELLRSAANLLERRSETARAVQARALGEELEVHLRGELNLLEEAHNAELIPGLAASEDTIVVPAVVRPHVSERVLVLERVRRSDPRAVADAARRRRARLHPRAAPEAAALYMIWKIVRTPGEL